MPCNGGPVLSPTVNWRFLRTDDAMGRASIVRVRETIMVSRAERREERTGLLVSDYDLWEPIPIPADDQPFATV